MTKFIDNTVKKEKKELKETVFNKDIYKHEVVNSVFKPQEFDFVEFIGHSSDYGDVFKAWDKGWDDFYIIFGIKGDEFS